MIIQYIFSLSLIYVISFANIKAALINIVILPMDQTVFIVIGATPHDKPREKYHQTLQFPSAF